MMIITDTNESQNLLLVGNSDRTDLCFFINNTGNLIGVFAVKASTQNTDRAIGNAQCAAGKGR